jgi:hypothetical protein
MHKSLRALGKQGCMVRRAGRERLPSTLQAEKATLQAEKATLTSMLEAVQVGRPVCGVTVIVGLQARPRTTCMRCFPVLPHLPAPHSPPRQERLRGAEQTAAEAVAHEARHAEATEAEVADLKVRRHPSPCACGLVPAARASK